MENLKPLVLRTAYQATQQDNLSVIADKVFLSCNGNPAYAPVNNEVAAVGAARTTYANLLAESKKAGKVLTYEKNLARKALVAALNALANGLEANANGSPLYIMQAGLECRSTPQRHTNPPLPPKDLTAASNGQRGQAYLRYELTDNRGVVRVAVEWSKDRETWHNGTYGAASGRRSHVVVKGLPELTGVHFRLRCLGTHGTKSEWSEEATCPVL